MALNKEQAEAEKVGDIILCPSPCESVPVFFSSDPLFNKTPQKYFPLTPVRIIHERC